MNCPVCGGDCIEDAPVLLARLPHTFVPCPDCMGLTYDKRAPPPGLPPAQPCPSCGKRFIDEVFAQIYLILVEEGDLTGGEPLAAAGTPLIHPGFALERAPYLPAKSLVLLSRVVTQKAADRLVAEVPEIRGVVRGGAFVPGLEDIDGDGIPETHTLLAGCDVRANIFYNQKEPLVIYKQTSTMHIEFPRGYDPKIISVGSQIRKNSPKTFVDACCGPGTLGLLSALMEVPHVIMNDAWYAAAFFAAFNTQVNREHFDIEEVVFLRSFKEMQKQPVATEPVKVAETVGEQVIEVYQGDFRRLPAVLPAGVDLTVIDLFHKKDPAKNQGILDAWRLQVGGGVFIP